MYEFRDNKDEAKISQIAEIIKGLEYYETNDKLIAKSLRMYETYAGKTNFIRYNGKGDRCYILRNGAWSKSVTYSPITPKAEYNGAGFTHIDNYSKNE